MLTLLLVAVKLLIVHEPSNHREIIIYPPAITSLHPTKTDPNDDDRLMTKETGCVIMMTDGRFVSSTESCEEVRKRIEEIER
jgi:hypothetical protein